MQGNLIEFSLEDIKSGRIPGVQKYWSLESIVSQKKATPFRI